MNITFSLPLSYFLSLFQIRFSHSSDEMRIEQQENRFWCARRRCFSMLFLFCSLYEITSNVHITHGNDHQRKPVFLMSWRSMCTLFLFWKFACRYSCSLSLWIVLSSLQFARLANTHLEFKTLVVCCLELCVCTRAHTLICCMLFEMI